MKKIRVVILVLSFLILSGNLYAEKKGADLLIQKTNGEGIRSELIAVKENSLLLIDRDSGADVSIDIRNIQVFKIMKESYAPAGILTGLLIGIVSGVATGSESNDDQSKGGFSKFSNGFNFMGSAVGFGLIGALVGGIIGTIASGADEIIQIEGKSDSKIQEILEKLHKKARIRNYQ